MMIKPKEIKLTEIHKNIEDVIVKGVLQNNDTLLVDLDKGPVDGKGQMIIMSTEQFNKLNK